MCWCCKGKTAHTLTTELVLPLRQQTSYTHITHIGKETQEFALEYI